MKKGIGILLLVAGFFTICITLNGDIYKDYDFVFAVVKYGGGGDWYNGLTGVRHFIQEVKKRTGVNISPKEKIVSLSDDDLFLYPFIYINGHGNIKLTDEELKKLRTYLQNGGFLFCNDDYGLKDSFIREMKKVFPDKELIPVPFTHPIYHIYFNFPEGLPKIHEHDPGPAQGLGLFYQNRLVVFFAFNSDIGDGWEKEYVFHDPEEARESAIRMGINIIYYSLLY